MFEVHGCLYSSNPEPIGGGNGLSEVVNGRPTVRTEMGRDHISSRISDPIRAGAGAIRGRLRTLDGKLPRRRFTFDLHLLVWESRLDGERAARLLLAQKAVAHDDPVWVGACAGHAELPAIAGSRTGPNVGFWCHGCPLCLNPYFTSSISPACQLLSKNDFSGLYSRSNAHQPFFGSVWIQLPRSTPAGCVGAK